MMVDGGFVEAGPRDVPELEFRFRLDRRKSRFERGPRTKLRRFRFGKPRGVPEKSSRR